MAATNKLTVLDVKNARFDGKPFKLADGNCMSLFVNKTGRYWRFDYTFAGKNKTISFGSADEVSLAEARAARTIAREKLRAGIDPSEARKQAKQASITVHANTFETVAREWHKEFTPTWSPSNAEKNLRILVLNAFPWIGSRPIAEIAAPELLACLRRAKDRGLLDTAHRLRQVAGMVFRYGICTGRCERDIAADLKGALPARQQKHMAALTDPEAFGALLRDLWTYKGSFVTACALKLSAYFALRPGELRNLEWSEVDLEKRLIRIPMGKMKARRLHLVPLTNQADVILEELRDLTGTGKYAFPGLQSRDRPMSENTVNAALRRLGYDTQAEQSAHGFRSSFSTMAHASGLFRPEVVEVQLAHKHGDATRLAYDRGDFLEERRKLMVWWADECDRMREGAKILAFKPDAETKCA